MTDRAKNHKNRNAVAVVMTIGVFVLAGAGQAAAEPSCEPPAVAALDQEGGHYCAEPNLDCYEDHPPTYLANGEWLCPSVEEVQAKRRLEEGPQISCPMGALIWNAEAEDWTCEDLNDCQACERCYLYVELAKNQCVQSSQRLARAKCNGSYGSTWRGERVDPRGRTCETKTIQDQMTGKVHTIETNCTGPAIEECVGGWKVSAPASRPAAVAAPRCPTRSAERPAARSSGSASRCRASAAPRMPRESRFR